MLRSSSAFTVERRKSTAFCHKHDNGKLYHSHLHDFMQLKELSKSLPPALEEMRKLVMDRVHAMLTAYLDSDCVCWEIVSMRIEEETTLSMGTMRRGASWASDFDDYADVANLADVEDL